MREALLIAFLASAVVAVPSQQYHQPKDHISENNIDKVFCKSSHDCKGYGEVCERVCLWQEYTKKFVGCKVQCVSPPEYPHADGYKHQILPYALPHEVAVPPAPKYEPSYAPEKKYCKTDYDCGYNQQCSYGKECICKYGFQPDPHDHTRCIDLKPKYGAQEPYHPPKHEPEPYHPEPKKPEPYHPAPQYPEPHHPEPYKPQPTYHKKEHPKPHHPRTCHNEYDCPHGEKCCYWRKCNAYNICAVEYKCAKYC